MKFRFLLVAALFLFAVGCSSSGGDDGNNDDDSTANDGVTDVVADVDDDGVDPETMTDEVDPDVDSDVTDPDVVDPDVDAVDLGTTDAIEDVSDVDSVDPDVGDATDVDPDLDVVEDTEDATTLPQFFESPEMVVQIVGPSATGTGESIATQLSVAGIVVGEPEYISWEHENGQTGYAQGSPFFVTSPIQLVKGDNRITVTAHDGDESSSDTIIITHNPVFIFGNELTVKPGLLFTNSSAAVIFSLDMGVYSNFDAATLTLCEANAEGECINNVNVMKDDGMVGTSGDEVAEDGVYSWKKTYNIPQAGQICFRVWANVYAGYQEHVAYSQVKCIDVVEKITQSSCEDTKTLHGEADTLYWDTLGTSDEETAQQAVVDFLEASDSVAEVGKSPDGYGVWVLYTNGILGAFQFSPDGLRAGGGNMELTDYEMESNSIVMSKQSVVFSPFHEDFEDYDEADHIHELLAAPQCPPYVLAGAAPLTGSQASLSKFRSLNRYGIVALTGHGDAYFTDLSADVKADYGWDHSGSQEVVWTGEPVDCSKFNQNTGSCTGPGTCPSGSECVITEASNNNNQSSGICVDYKHADLQKGRIVMGNGTYGITPAFIEHYRGIGYPRSVIYLGTCRSFWNGTMALKFYAAGARAIAGYSGYVSHEFAYGKGNEFFDKLLQEKKRVGGAIPENSEDPQNEGTKFRVMGDFSLDASDSNLINPSWETGELTGWLKDGDGRVIQRLGMTLPVEGKFMALISTGMGFTPQVGEIYQTFCIPEDTLEMSFYWKYYSEEFQEFCGSSFQDTFEATLEGDVGFLELESLRVDDLCPVSQCSGCGGSYVGLIDSDVSFDQGDVWNTPWQKTEVYVTQLAGQGPVTLRFFCTDLGDSIYDTVVLVDTVKFE